MSPVIADNHANKAIGENVEKEKEANLLYSYQVVNGTSLWKIFSRAIYDYQSKNWANYSHTRKDIWVYCLVEIYPRVNIKNGVTYEFAQKKIEEAYRLAQIWIW